MFRNASHISKIILVPGSWLNLFLKLLLVKEVKSGALVGRKRVKRERESRGLVIPIFDIMDALEEKISTWENFLVHILSSILRYKNFLNILQ
jgi:hypothetical protein